MKNTDDAKVFEFKGKHYHRAGEKGQHGHYRITPLGPPAPEPAKDGPGVVGWLDPYGDFARIKTTRHHEPLVRLSDYETLRATLDGIGTKVAEIQTKERPHPVKIVSRGTQMSPIHVVVFSDGSVYDFELGWRSH